MVVQELSALLAAGERAAFHGVPADGTEPLRRAENIAREAGDEASRAQAAWLAGVCLAAGGDYGQALAGLTAAAGDPTVPDHLRALPATAVGSIQRQLGRHAEGLAWDRGALDAASGHALLTCEALLGLGSDSVGLGDVVGAREALDEAGRLGAGEGPWWRQGVRLDWLRCELCLVTDDAVGARVAAEEALVAAEAANAPRHIIRSLLLGGVAAVAAGDGEAAIDPVRRAAALAAQLGALPLLWPTEGLLAGLLAPSDPEQAQRHRAAAGAAAKEIAARLPAVLAEPWLARRDIRALVS